MKRIITAILSVILSLTISAQDRTPMDKIWEEIEKITSVRQDSKMKINHGDGQLLYVHNDIVGKEFLCSTDCEGVTSSFENMTPEEIEAANERNRKVFDGIFGVIRHNLDSLMEISEESYHFESHSHANDTITYSLCLKNGEDSIARIKANDGTMFYPGALEIVFFNYTASPKPCGKHIRGFGTLGYNKRLPLPGGKSYYFDKEPYLETIKPLLKQKGIKSWNFKWAYSEDYDIDSNRYQEFVSGGRVAFGPKNAGQTLGTMYFIPREQKELAEAIFTAIDSTTLRYTEIHPEQMFRYCYYVKEQVMQYTESNNITGLFEGCTGKGNLSTHVLFGITSQGYYVAVADTENNVCIPKEWYMLRSFVNGKREYIKGARSFEPSVH